MCSARGLFHPLIRCAGFLASFIVQRAAKAKHNHGLLRPAAAVRQPLALTALSKNHTTILVTFLLRLLSKGWAHDFVRTAGSCSYSRALAMDTALQVRSNACRVL